MTAHVDTIAAIATAPGRGGIGVVRVSGPASPRDRQAHARRRATATRTRTLRRFMDRDDVRDRRWASRSIFPARISFTGEDMLELHGHGGPVVMDLLLHRVLELGARAAAPGEFTQRAFLNDKLDLAQAEAVADLIDSGSAQAARAALRSLQGEFSAHVHELAERVLELRMWIEAAIDFPEEEVDFLADRALGARMDDLRQRFAELAETARQGALLRDGLTVVIAGRPNAGKSSLLNRLAGYEAAIVTPIPGTTRDVLRERIAIDGLPLHVLDTAGLRESPTRSRPRASGVRTRDLARRPRAVRRRFRRSGCGGGIARTSRVCRRRAAHARLEQDRSQRRDPNRVGTSWIRQSERADRAGHERASTSVHLPASAFDGLRST